MMKCLWLLLLLPSPSIVSSTSPTAEQRAKIANITRLLDTLLTDYDKKIRPGVNRSGALLVNISIGVVSTGPVGEEGEEYSMDCYFRQTWLDERLAHHSEQFATLPLGLTMLDKIWKPDTYFWNGKRAFLHTLTTDNRLVRLDADGTVLYSSRLTITTRCPMNFKYYPNDWQACMVKLGSFGHAVDDLHYSWLKVTIGFSQMAQFELREVIKRDVIENFSGGNYSTLEVYFVMKRLMGFYIINFYFPSVLIVLLSFLAFWLPREETADRFGLGVTCVLAMTFISIECRTHLPKIGYATALDKYILFCFALLFFCIWECTIVHINTKHNTGDHALRKYERARTAQLRRMGLLPWQMNGRRSVMAPMLSLLPSMGVHLNHHLAPDPRRMSIKSRSRHRLHRIILDWIAKGKKADPADTEINSVSSIDRISRVLFPLIFAVYTYLYYANLVMSNEAHRPAV